MKLIIELLLTEFANFIIIIKEIFGNFDKIMLKS